jgi:3,4-dihydroxy-9,10-secoandrosta-1,3,5(10)-triene-9,17-dione 4,5-dioxygenase|tara:strand:+ start:239533 stop:240426 length:894 start_codon:yes stop_codon:yes gene_type:complete
MGVRSLAYIRIEAQDLDAWRSFGEGVVGAAATAESDADTLFLRIDDRPWRFCIEKGSRDHFIAAGLEFPTEEAFREGVAKLRNAGVELTDGDAATIKHRQVKGMVMCQDPGGNHLELVWGNPVAGTPFVSPAGVSQFVTADMGLGHVVFPTDKYEETRSFYKDLLGFGDSDEMRVMLPDGPEQGLGMSFMHATGPRHHTVAVTEFPSPTGLIHTMVEVSNIDEVGLALDRAVKAGVHISSSLGRHTNDKMISFYMRTPSGFDIEYGCDGIQTHDWSRYTPTVTAKEDLWGHTWDFGN